MSLTLFLKMMMMMTMLWVLASCRFTGRYKRFGEIYYLHFQN
jgi:hypothetical protein